MASPFSGIGRVGAARNAQLYRLLKRGSSIARIDWPGRGGSEGGICVEASLFGGFNGERLFFVVVDLDIMV